MLYFNGNCNFDRFNLILVLVFMIILIAPMKALCEERLVDWHRKFTNYGLLCISVTGDSDNIDFQSLLSYNLIITTPEKWDSLTRRWRNNRKLPDLVKLFLIDEIHLVGENNRGPTLEVVVCRMKTIQESLSIDNDSMLPSANMRFVAVSATVPNVVDLADWLRTPLVSAKSFKFGDSMRPVHLKKVVIGYPYNSQTSTPFKFDLMLNYKLQSIMVQYAEGKPTLIFCSTRKSVEMTSKQITQNITINLNPQQKQVLVSATNNIQETKIREILVNGVCYHHAGLSLEDRRIIEDLFRNCNLPILVTTCTLAMGVNLPAHLVIIKSTKYYSNGEYLDYSESMLLQMIGRAGRPQFDISATAVILTTFHDKKKIENMIDGEQSIESYLHKHLTEHLNAEIVLRTITDLGVAMQWLTSTFLYIRARKHPKHYGLPLGLTQDEMDRRLLDMCQIEINRLARAGMLVIDDTSTTIQPTNTGLLMAKYCVAFDTMKLFTEVTGKEVLQQMLGLISKCREFSEIYLRVNDKKALNLLNKCRNRETIRFPFNDRIKTVDMKINCIIQAVFGCLQILEQSLVTESQKIMKIGERISKCLAEYLETKGDCYSALQSALILAKCFHTRLWENSLFVSRQLAGIGNVFSTALVNAGKATFKDILETNPREIERIIHRKAPMGNTIQDAIAHLPDYELLLEEVLYDNNLTVNLIIRLKNSEVLKVQSTVNVNSVISLLVGDTNNHIILYEKQLHSNFIENPETVKTFEFPLDYSCEIMAHLISEDWVGFDCNVSLILSSVKTCNSTGATGNKTSLKHSSEKTSTDNNTRQETFKKIHITNKRNSKHPSHIQTFMETYFRSSKPKNQKKNHDAKNKPSTKPCPSKTNLESNRYVQKVVTLKLPVPTLQPTVTKCTKSDHHEKNAISTSIEIQEEPNSPKTSKGYQDHEEHVTSTSTIVQAEVHLSNERWEDVDFSNLERSTNLSNENVVTDNFQEKQNEITLQSLIDSSIKEYRKDNDNKFCNTSQLCETNDFYTILSKQTNPSNTSVVHSDDLLVTARRVETPTQQTTRKCDLTAIITCIENKPVDGKKKFRLRKNINYNVNFENSLSGACSKTDENPAVKEFNRSNFKYTPKRYSHHPSIIQQRELSEDDLVESETGSTKNNIKTPRNKSRSEKLAGYRFQEILTPTERKDGKSFISFAKPNENLQKTLTWRSPLVISPIVTYSPNLDKSFGQTEGRIDSPLHKWNRSDAIPAIPVRGEKSHLRFSIRANNDALETSTSTSDANSTLKTSTSARPTLKQNRFKNTDCAPLSDEAFLMIQTNESPPNYKTNTEDELISTSFLEDLGILRKQSEQNNVSQKIQVPQKVNVRPQNRKRKSGKVPTISDYYSRVIRETKPNDLELHRFNKENVKVENSFCTPKSVDNNQSSNILQNSQENMPSSTTGQCSSSDKIKDEDLSDITFDFDMETTVIPQMFGSKMNEINNSFSNNPLSFEKHHEILPSGMRDVKNIFENSKQFYNHHLTPEFDMCSKVSHNQSCYKNFPTAPKRNFTTQYHHYNDNSYSLLKEEFRGLPTDHCQCHKCVEKYWRPSITDFGNMMSSSTQLCNCLGHEQSFYRNSQPCCFRNTEEPIIKRQSMTQNVLPHSQSRFNESPKCCSTSLHRNYSFSSHGDFNDYSHETIKKQNLSSFQRIPSFQERYILSNTDGPYTGKHHHDNYHEGIRNCCYPRPHFRENGPMRFSEYNQGDKEYVLQRYLNSVKERNVQGALERVSHNYEGPEADHLNFTICLDGRNMNYEATTP